MTFPYSRTASREMSLEYPHKGERMLTTHPESFAPPYHYVSLSSPQRTKTQTDAIFYANKIITHGSQVTVLYH